MPSATYGVGVYGTDSYGEVVIPAVVPSPRDRPPLRVTVEIETPRGKHYRWAEDESDSINVPSGLRWSDTMPGGFESFDCTLPRKAGIDYGDLEQLSTIRVRGASGDIAGEYRLERAPRTSGDQVAISPGAVGWQAHLEDDKSAAEIYRDVDLSRWGGQSVARKISLLATGFYTGSDASVQPDTTSGEPAVALEITGSWLNTTRPYVEAWYDAGWGNAIGQLHIGWKSSSINHADANWQFQFGVATDMEAGGGEATIDLAGVAPPSSTTFTATTAKRYGWIVLLYAAGPAGADNFQQGLYCTTVAVYGDHGLTKRGTEPNAGFYASDVVRHAVGAWAPSLTTTSESVQQSGFIVPHMAFFEPTTVGEIVRQATRFGLQDWAVWDNRTFWWHERGAHSKQWRSRVAPAQLDETGPQVDRLWESIIVSFQDVDGSTRTVGPPGSGANTEDAALKDYDPANPANQLGIVRRDILQMGTSTAAGAIEVGRRFLEQSRTLDRSGRARIVGHVEDDRGVLHPYWRPRAGDYISFVDAADSSPRRIVKTDKDHASRTCGLDLDAPPEGLQALLERLGVVLVPLGLS